MRIQYNNEHFCSLHHTFVGPERFFAKVIRKRTFVDGGYRTGSMKGTGGTGHDALQRGSEQRHDAAYGSKKDVERMLLTRKDS